MSALSEQPNTSVRLHRFHRLLRQAPQPLLTIIEFLQVVRQLSRLLIFNGMAFLIGGFDYREVGTCSEYEMLPAFFYLFSQSFGKIHNFGIF